MRPCRSCEATGNKGVFTQYLIELISSFDFYFISDADNEETRGEGQIKNQAQCDIFSEVRFSLD